MTDDVKRETPTAPPGRKLCSGRCWLQPGEVNHPAGMIFVGWGHGWQPCARCGGEGLEPINEVIAAAREDGRRQGIEEAGMARVVELPVLDTCGGCIHSIDNYGAATGRCERRDAPAYPIDTNLPPPDWCPLRRSP